MINGANQRLILHTGKLCFLSTLKMDRYRFLADMPWPMSWLLFTSSLLICRELSFLFDTVDTTCVQSTNASIKLKQATDQAGESSRLILSCRSICLFPVTFKRTTVNKPVKSKLA